MCLNSMPVNHPQEQVPFSQSPREHMWSGPWAPSPVPSCLQLAHQADGPECGEGRTLPARPGAPRAIQKKASQGTWEEEGMNEVA